jgi:D-lactate dehydrogenase (cytochrome)
MNEIIAEAVPEIDLAKVRCIEGYDEIARNHAPYLADESKLADQGADYLFYPKNEAELAAVLREMGRRGVNVTISAARTGLAGGAVPYGGAVVSLDRFDKPLGIRKDAETGEWRVMAECSVTLKDLGEWIKKKNFPGLKETASEETMANLEKFRDDMTTFFYPPDPTEMSASLGGTVATNASGAASYKYGASREWVRRLRIMLASGEVLDIPRGKYKATDDGTIPIRDTQGNAIVLKVPSYKWPKTKNTAGVYAAPGMDPIDLFIGSEGLFGVITQLEVGLVPWHGTMSVVQFLPSDQAAIDLVIALRGQDDLKPEFLEFYDAHALDLLRERQRENIKVIDMPMIPEDAGAAIFFDIEFDPESADTDLSKLGEMVAACGSSLANSWAGYERRDLARFRHFRHALPETVNGIIGERKKEHPTLHKLGTDFAVPDEALREMWNHNKERLGEMGLEWVAFGHIGDNHFHINILPRNADELALGLDLYKEFAAKAVSFGGTVSAEHGIGKIKRKFLPVMFTPEHLDEMKAIKLALDPKAMINPGNILEIRG